jgi:hypothetical protein
MNDRCRSATNARKYPYFRDVPKSNDNSRSSSQSIFVEPPHHPTPKDSASLFFPSNVLITETRMLPEYKKNVEEHIVLGI